MGQRKSSRNVFRVLTSLVISTAVWLVINLALFQIVVPVLLGGIKSLGTFPNGFLVIGVSLFSIYLSAKLGGYVWKRLS